MSRSSFSRRRRTDWLCRLHTSVADLFSPSAELGRLRAPVELKPKRPPKGGKCAFGGIGLGSFESRVVHFTKKFAAAFSRPMSLPDMLVPFVWTVSLTFAVYRAVK